MSLDPGRTMPQDQRDWLRWCFEQRTWSVAVKNADETRNSVTSISPDAELQFPIKANEVAVIRAQILFETTANADFSFGIRGPSSPTRVRIGFHYTDAGESTVETGRQEDFSSFKSTSSTGGSVGWIDLVGVIQNGSNAGNISFDWAQASSSVDDTTVLLGSLLEYQYI